jgi:hypothetical protein
MNIGNVPVPDIVVSGIFPVTPDYHFGRAFLHGAGRQSLHYRAQMGKVLRDGLADFWRLVSGDPAA